ncbi:MAG TPA: hypothetical protein VFX70_21325 [Mycobacteriales bacterium]|nr:hypothetical protein [Mycobacteriales bacterium]
MTDPDPAKSEANNEPALTPEELATRHAAATAYIREHLIPDFGPDDIAAGERMWQDLAAGHLTHLE